MGWNDTDVNDTAPTPQFPLSWEGENTVLDTDVEARVLQDVISSLEAETSSPSIRTRSARGTPQFARINTSHWDFSDHEESQAPASEPWHRADSSGVRFVPFDERKTAAWTSTATTRERASDLLHPASPAPPPAPPQLIFRAGPPQAELPPPIRTQQAQSLVPDRQKPQSLVPDRQKPQSFAPNRLQPGRELTPAPRLQPGTFVPMSARALRIEPAGGQKVAPTAMIHLPLPPPAGGTWLTRLSVWVRQLFRR